MYRFLALIALFLSSSLIFAEAVGYLYNRRRRFVFLVGTRSSKSEVKHSTIPLHKAGIIRGSRTINGFLLFQSDTVLSKVAAHTFNVKERGEQSVEYSRVAVEIAVLLSAAVPWQKNRSEIT